MKRFLKISAIVALSVASVAGLTACGGGEKEKVFYDPIVPAQPEDANAHAKNKEIVFYSTQGQDPSKVTEKAIESFEAKFPGWTVKHVTAGGYDQLRDKISSDLQAGTQPDLAYCYPDHVARYIPTKKVVNMSHFIESTSKVKGVAEDGSETEYTIGFTKEEISDIIPGYYNEGKAKNFDGFKPEYAENLVTLPFSKSTEALYYNQTVLDELGLAVPKTWDELWEACRVVKTKYPESTPLGYDSEANWFITMCEQNDWEYTSIESPHYRFNNENTVNWLTELKGIFAENLFTTKTLFGGYTSELFIKGPAQAGSVFSIGSTGGASHQFTKNFTWGVAPIPGSKQADGSIRTDNISQGPSLVMFDTKDKGNAYEKAVMTFMFVKELLDPTFQAEFSQLSGYMPVRISTSENPTFQEWMGKADDIIAVTINVALSAKDSYFVSPAFNGSSTARDQVGTALRYAITGQKTPEKALKDAVRKCGK